MLKRLLKYYKYKVNYQKRNTVIRSLDIGKNFKIGDYCIIAKRVIIGDDVSIGSFTYLNASKYWITVESKVKIGNYCSIAPGVHIGAGNHNYHYITTHPILFDKYYKGFLNNLNIQKTNGLKDKDDVTTIGNDVWIGLNAIIKRGVKIGNGAVIAAGAVVVSDVPEYAIVGGNPSKIIKYRFKDDEVQKLIDNESSMFWNWNKEKIINNFDKLYNIEDYINYIESSKN